MAAYLKFYALERPPFGEGSGSGLVLGTKALREAFETIRSSLDEGASRICVSGGAGLGKTSLARALPRLLGEQARVALVLDPSVPWDSLRDPIARQWGLARTGLARSRLLAASRKRRLVLVVDQAETASEEFLDHLDVLLCYRSEDERSLVQSVLLANLETRDRREPAPLIWWLDRIHTLQLEFAPLPRDGVGPYIEKHLKRAGWQGGALFTRGAAQAIHEITGGIPGEVGRLCERLLAEAAPCDLLEIDADFVHAACEAADDPDPTPPGESEEPWTLDLDAEEAASLVGPGALRQADDDAWDADFPSRPDMATLPRWQPVEERPETVVSIDDSLAAPALSSETPAGGLPVWRRPRQLALLAAAAAFAITIGWSWLWTGSSGMAEGDGVVEQRGEATTADPGARRPRVLARLRGPVVVDASPESSEQTSTPTDAQAP
jgi:type II secretory pathway predicted ATPase ExeA